MNSNEKRINVCKGLNADGSPREPLPEPIPFPNAVDIAIDSFDFECMEDANDRVRARAKGDVK